MEIDRDKEIWKNIEGYEGIYQVSSFGRLKSLKRKSVPNDRILNGTVDKDGYKRVKLKCLHKKEKKMAAHRLVALAFILNPFKKAEVNHINGIKDDNRSVNLEWCTGKENNMHALQTGLVHCKLNAKQVANIRNIYLNKEMKQVEIAKMFNVAKSTISQIVNNKSRKYI